MVNSNDNRERDSSLLDDIIVTVQDDGTVVDANGNVLAGLTAIVKFLDAEAQRKMLKE